MLRWGEAAIREHLVRSLACSLAGGVIGSLERIEPTTAVHYRIADDTPDGDGYAHRIDRNVGGRHMLVATAKLIGETAVVPTPEVLAVRLRQFQSELVFIFDEVLAGRDPYPPEKKR